MQRRQATRLETTAHFPRSTDFLCLSLSSTPLQLLSSPTCAMRGMKAKSPVSLLFQRTLRTTSGRQSKVDICRFELHRSSTMFIIASTNTLEPEAMLPSPATLSEPYSLHLLGYRPRSTMIQERVQILARVPAKQSISDRAWRKIELHNSSSSSKGTLTSLARTAASITGARFSARICTRSVGCSPHHRCY